MQEFLTVGQVAKLLSCSNYHVNMLVDRGEVKGHRLQRRGWNRIDKKSLVEYAAKLDLHLDWNEIAPH